RGANRNRGGLLPLPEGVQAVGRSGRPPPGPTPRVCPRPLSSQRMSRNAPRRSTRWSVTTRRRGITASSIPERSAQASAARGHLVPPEQMIEPAQLSETKPLGACLTLGPLVAVEPDLGRVREIRA